MTKDQLLFLGACSILAGYPEVKQGYAASPDHIEVAIRNAVILYAEMRIDEKVKASTFGKVKKDEVNPLESARHKAGV